MGETSEMGNLYYLRLARLSHHRCVANVVNEVVAVVWQASSLAKPSRREICASALCDVVTYPNPIYRQRCLSNAMGVQGAY
jgi:hypothetical protein